MLLQIAIEAIQPYVSLSVEQIKDLLEIPPSAEMGDVAFPCYTLSKIQKQAPHTIAEQLARQMQLEGIQVTAEGPYVNLRYDRGYYSNILMQQMQHPHYGQLNIGHGKKVIIDMSSPNIAKPFGIGHLRSTMIGSALYNMYQMAGYEVVSVNHLGDWGTQFGKQITAYKRWGNDEALIENPIQESLRLYVAFHDQVEHDVTLEPEAREWFRRLESGDEEAVRLWKYFVEISMQEFNRMYTRLHVSFDHVLGESFYNDKMAAVVQALEEKELLERSEGALVVRLDEEGMPPCLIMKSDGSTIYPTRDLATAFYRHEVMQGDQLLYVVGGEQKLHFEQVFAVLKKMGATWVDHCRHVHFGLMKFEGKKMSTRRGKIVQLEEVLDEAIARALQVIEDKNPDLPNKHDVAEAVGIGAIVFGDLKNNRVNEVDFSLEDALNFEGETGPYLQYTYTRTQSLILKSKVTEDRVTDDRVTEDEQALLNTPQEQPVNPLGESGWELLKVLTRYSQVLTRGILNNEPSVLARYALEVAQAFNYYYNKERILEQNHDLRTARLTLTQLTGDSLQRTMHILGIRTPNRM
ncbi:arginyl-tRNA synthetase [Paenibacillus sp. DS2015]|uniref:arginine--tRNA ligase n=1 Tax=Paenibacillus sp. DS2015 TaxID=3373917 RepID=UPI003D213780